VWASPRKLTGPHEPHPGEITCPSH
jgi:hypothetical protein